ncbi:MAG: DUF1294 domain-containing protein [Eubacteriaceae bacterium]|nr:DUF1294 domain-containing protein [Eubacteriaceae bacterium]
MKYLIYYLLFINIIAFVAVFIDKQKAKKNRYRISEKALFILASIGGSIGTYISMLIFRHKTKKWYFKIGIPFIIIIQIILAYYLIKNYL